MRFLNFFMAKIKFLTALLALSISAKSQKLPTDTTPRRDSLIQEAQENMLDNTATISLDENDMGDAGTQNISSMLTAGRDPFFNAASYNFSALRFRMRGYENDLFSTYMNGIPMDNLDNGFTPYGQWGGLNDMMRNRDVSYGLRFNTFAFGDIGSNTMIDSRASRQRAQTSANYSLSNRNYTHRVMLSHATGLSPKGWAFAISGSRRYADEGYVPGTYYDGYSYFGAIDKRINAKHLLSLVAFGAPTENGRQGASTQEVYDLVGSNFYNPNWGYQNGKKRNASVAKSHQPVGIFTHEYKIDPNTTLTTAVSYTGGDRAVTALDWYNAADPRPDYYRYLPSYYNGITNRDSNQYLQLVDLFKNNPDAAQINWQRLYDANRGNVRTYQNANNIPGNVLTGKRSLYIIENRVINTKRINFNTTLNKNISEHVDFTGGLSYQAQKNHYYKEVEDLLGGDFYINLNQFGERDFPTNAQAAQNDAEHPNRILKTGDKFGYDYNINATKAEGWSQGVFRYSKVDFFIAANLSHAGFYRTGNVRNGLFLNNSLGKSTDNKFTNYGVKGGATYKIDGRNYLYANAYTGTKAPYFENIYLSPRTRNSQQPDISSEKIMSLEGGYNMASPKAKVHLSGYYTTFKDQMDMISFFHDGFQNFVNYALRGIDKEHMGLEIGIEYKIDPTLSVNAAAAIGKYTYNSRPIATISYDNLDSVTASQIIYQKNYNIPSTPQQAYSLGLNYRSPKFWFVNLSGNYFAENWLSINPIRRTYEATDGMDHASDAFRRIIDQQQFDPQFTLDLFAGYSYKLKKKINGKNAFLVLNAAVNNILNNKNINTGGYEQLRYDDANRDINKFPPKLYYAYGLNYNLSVTFRF